MGKTIIATKHGKTVTQTAETSALAEKWKVAFEKNGWRVKGAKA